MPPFDFEALMQNPIAAMGIGLLTSNTPQEGIKQGIGLLSQASERKRQQELDKLREQELRMKMNGTADKPANIREWEIYSSLPPDQQKQYLVMKRAQQVMDLGGTKAVRDPLGGISENYPVTPKPDQMPDFKRQQEASKEVGKSQGGAQVNLPDIIAQGEQTVSLVDDLLKDPGLETSVGMKGPTAWANFGSPVPGTEAANFTTRLDQLKGKQFMEAYQGLKGGGQITEVEGKKATDAIARMNTAQTEDAFKAAASEFQSVIKNGIERAKLKASLPTAAEVFPTEDLAPLPQPKRLKFNRATGRLE